MTTLLRIDASSRTEGSHSRELADFFVQEWLSNNSNGQVVHRDLVKRQVTPISETTISGFYTSRAEMSQVQKEATQLSDDLIQELKSADVLLIATPMYNFSIPSALKAWIDQIVRIGETFSFTDGQFIGLVENKPTYVLVATGAVFSNEGMQDFDFLSPYLRFLLNFLGITNVEMLSIEGTTTDDEALKRSTATAQKKILSLGDKS